MKLRSYLLLFILLFVSSVPACTPVVKNPKSTQVLASTAAASTTATRSLPTPKTQTTHAPDAESAAKTFLEAWKAEDYASMYAMLTPASQDALAQEKFTQRYQETAISMTMQKLDYEILSKMTNPASAQVAYKIIFHTKMLGDITRDNMLMNLSLEKGAWRVQWDEGLILPDLRGGNTLALDLKTPTRGNIYDKNGNAIAAASDVFALGIRKGDINPDQESRLLGELSRLTGKTPESIKAMYDQDYIYQGTYVAIGEAPRDEVLQRYDVLSSLSGLYMNEYQARFYFDGGIAPHVTGYVQPIPAEEKDQYLREGYRLDERVGRSGIEKWGEKYLIGQRGASLYVDSPQGSPITRLAQVEAKPSESIYMTIDNKLQLEAQRAIAGFNGAIVVIERDSGRVLAMVSSPGFDPNAFDPQNFNSGAQLGQITGDGLNRLFNRATGDGYPLGSVFKIITMSAALESGIFTPETKYDCLGTYTDLPGETLYDWTHDKGLPPSGILTLPEGLMRSCNPWFYNIGVTLFNQGHQKDISNMARAFGLGSTTGIDQVAEKPGNIPDPTDASMAARLAIGQSEVLVNPLQVARFVAAVGNGGTLYRPQVVEKITDPDGKASFTFKPEAQGKLPVKPENLQVIQDAMRRVVSDPRGTAVRAFSGLNLPIYGKTGTAQNDFPGHPHAWFAGYTNTGRTDKPDIAFAVIAEYAGEGSDIAAPIARRLLEVYYLGQPQRVYPWESRINVTRTPTPNATDVSAPQPQQQQPQPIDTPVPPSSGDQGGNPGGDFKRPHCDAFQMSEQRLAGWVTRMQSGFVTVLTEEAGGVICHLRGRLKKHRFGGDILAIGDHVQVSLLPDGSGMIEDIVPRERELARMAPTPRGEFRQILLANPDQVVLVFACAHPEPRLRMLDRFLVICEKQGIPAFIVANKVDLVGADAAEAIFGAYPGLGYPVIYTSAAAEIGVEELHQCLVGKISGLAGPSGVGKSSLLNKIQPDLGLAVRSVSDTTSKGKHTTVVREMFPLKDGGFVADLPGLKSLALWDTDPYELDGYFPELRDLVSECQFSDCTHRNEPGCAVRKAVNEGRITSARYESYIRIRYGDEEG